MEFVIIIGIIGVFTILGVTSAVTYLFSPAARLRRTLARAPRYSIAEAVDGEIVKVAGRLEYAGDALEAPLSGRACVLFELVIEEYRSSGKSGRWVQIIREVGGRDFLLRDDTGKALVRVGDDDDRGRGLLIHKDVNRRSGTCNDATPDLEALLARHGHSSQGWFFNKAIRYNEGVLEEGEQVVVAGLGRWEPDPDPDPGALMGGYRDAPRRLVLGRSEAVPLLVSDDPSVLAKEWRR